VLPVAAALAMRGLRGDGVRPERSGSTARGLLNPRLLAVAVAGAALFFTFVATFTYVPYRLEEPPFSLSVYYGAGALGAYLPGLAWEAWGWPGVAACGLGALGIATLALAAANAEWLDTSERRRRRE
jgi:hypothetical protein